MKALRLHRVGDLRLHNEPRPTPGPGEVLLRVTAVGVCGSDLHWYSEAGIGDAKLERPLILGHEFAGVIESGQRCGQRVAVDPSVSCGNCEFCREGNPNLCSALRFAGHGVEDGALREYMVWPAKCCYPIPDTLTDAEAVMLEPLGVAIHAVDLGQVKPGMTVGVFGCGPLGLLLLQVARVAGAARLFATETLAHRLEAARALDVAAAFQADDGRESDKILALTTGKGVDVALEATEENGAVEAAIAATRSGGSVVLVGIPSDDRTAFTASVARRKGLTIKLTRRMKHAYPRAIRLVESGLVDVRALVTHHFPLAEFEAAFSSARRREGLKVIIEP
ncbi:MAG TPA: alcohol dehydrogenase catalytic domain-containing protein [Anaerolineae bacterium]|nr:alcohol dehydrogenase catalytic domain-containing protein [Anaerolineae bacterium]